MVKNPFRGVGIQLILCDGAERKRTLFGRRNITIGRRYDVDLEHELSGNPCAQMRRIDNIGDASLTFEDDETNCMLCTPSEEKPSASTNNDRT